MRTKRKAREEAAAMVAALGEGWTENVWKNIGWHFSTQSPCGRLTIYAHEQNGVIVFSGLLGDSDSHGGWCDWQSGTGPTPQEAAKASIRNASERLKAIGAEFTTGFLIDGETVRS